MSAADISEKKRTVCFRKLPLSSVVCWGSVVLFFLLFVAFFRGWLPVFPVAIATGSMEPSIQIGDAVILCQEDPADLQTGDIIRYEKNGKSVIHRIVDIRETKNGKTGFITKGDSNTSPDTGIVLPEAVTGKVICTLPKFGYVSLWLNGQL